MRARLLSLLFFLSLACGLASAQVYQVTAHIIGVEVDEAGSAKITEKFFLSFPNDYELQEFRSKSEQIGVDLAAWEQFNSSFKPSIGKGGEVVVNTIGFVENESNYLEIKYSLEEPLMKREHETSRMIEFSLNAKFFSEFLEGSFWVIPQNVTIIIDLPSQAEIQSPVKPEANVSGNRIVWTGYKSTNVLSLNYVLWKQISSFNLSELVNNIRNSETFPLLVAAIALVAAMLFLKRKTISAKIEAYIIEHSELSNVEEEE
jgi:hypothetical protein